MGLLNMCKGDLKCRYLSEFILLVLTSTAIFAVGTAFF